MTNLAASVNRTSAMLQTADRATEEAAALARERAQAAAREGRTCANQPGSTPGEGPLMRSRFAFAARASNLGNEARNSWFAPIADQHERLRRQVDALVKRVSPPASANVADAERAVLDKLAMASRLPAGERRALFTGLYEDARTFSATANDLRALHAAAFASRMDQLAAEVGPDPARPGSPDPARAAHPEYCWDVVLNEKITAAAAQLRAVEDVATPEFEFLEGPKATRAAFFGLIGWLAGAAGIQIAVDLGIVFLTLIGVARRPESASVAALAQGMGAPTPPRLSGILDG